MHWLRGLGVGALLGWCSISCADRGGGANPAAPDAAPDAERPAAVADASPSLDGTGAIEAGPDAAWKPVPDAGSPPIDSGEKSDAGVDVPCGDVPVTGECVSDSVLRVCSVPTGVGQPRLVTQSCRSFEHCVVGARGALCKLDADACVPNSSECLDTKHVRLCTSGARWQTTLCDGACKRTALGAYCATGTATGTVTYQGTLAYDAYAPDDTFSDWGATPTVLAAEGVLVTSTHGGNIVDSTLVDESGDFTLAVPDPATADDKILFFLVHPDSAGRPEYGVYNPHLSAGVATVPPDTTGGEIWHFDVSPLDFPTGSVIEITEKSGSGAVNLYTHMGAIRRITDGQYGRGGTSILAFFHPNTEWDCGGCFLDLPVRFDAFAFDSMVFISATKPDRDYWSAPVIAHEMGHYTMWTYGASPDEGGTHCVGVPAPPGLAWSEGWATGFSSLVREDPLYYDKQEGTMFWIDLEAKKYSFDDLWIRPKAKNGLLQDMDENEIASMIWELSQDPDVGKSLVYEGLRQPAATEAPFLRGYTRLAWDDVDDQCVPIRPIDTGETSPMFADYLDALRCLGAPAEAIDRVTDPSTAYPYPSEAPLCP